MLVFSVLDSKPTPIDVGQINAESAKKSQLLVKRLRHTIKQNQKTSIITISQNEINGLTALMHRAFPNVKADVRLSKYGAAAEASIGLPLPSFIQYLNINAYIHSSDAGLNIESISFGRFQFTGKSFLRVVSWFADTFIKEDLLVKALSMILGIDIDEQRIVAKLSFDKNLLKLEGNKSLFFSLRDDLALFGDVYTISYYYQSLTEFAETQNPQSSIASFIRYLFDLAKIRADISNDNQAMNENQAAMMALIIYFGADKFELMVGKVIIREEAKLIVRNKMRSSVTLQGRVDLQKHFIYSMALQLFSSHGASDALGEFKEFLDSNKGGSGFSFADLQADRAGTRLAMIVTKSEQHAIRSQQLLAVITDKQLLPDINGLHEGLNEDKFEKQFKDVQSEEYKNTLREIDNRLKSLAIYQLGWE